MIAGPRTPVRLGIIGLGAIGSEMLDAAAELPDVRVVLASDLDADTLARTHARHPDLALTTSPLEVAVAADVEAVYVATPPQAHHQLATAAMRAGKAVFCEKPLAIDPAEGREMVEVAAETGVVAAVNFALSDRHAVLRLEEIAADGGIGEVVGVDVRLGFPAWPRSFQESATWVGGRDQGGFVREVFSHFAYLTDRLVGPLHTVWASVDPGSGDAAEVAARAFLRAGGVPVHVSAFSGAFGPEEYQWTVRGTRGSYSLRNWGELLRATPDGWVRERVEGERGSEATRLRLFTRAVRGQRVGNLADFATAFRVQQLVEEIVRGT